MPLEIDETGIVEVSADDGTTWVPISDLTNISATHGRAEPTMRRVFGQADPHVRVGERSDSYSFSGLYTPADNGQTDAFEALESGDEVLIRYLPDGVNGRQQAARLTQFDISGESEGEFWEVSIGATGYGAVTNVP